MSAGHQSSVLGEVRVIAGPQQGTTFPITKTYVRIGRQSDNDVVLTHGSISRHHATIAWNGSEWHIQKVTQSSGLFINGNDVVQDILLVDGDHISLGTDVKISFQSYMHLKNTPSASVAPTVQRFTSPRPVPSGNLDPKLADPLRNLGHPVWIFVGLVCGIVGAIGPILAPLQDSIAKPVSSIISVVGFLICIGAVLRAKGIIFVPSVQKPGGVSPITPSPAAIAQHKVMQAKRNTKQSFAGLLVVNVLLLVVFTFLAIATDQHTSWSVWAALLLIGVLIMFINFSVTICRLVVKKEIKGKVVCTISAVMFVLLFFGFAAIGGRSPGAATSLAVAGLECLILLLITAVTMLVMWVRTRVQPSQQPSI